ncbi:MAG: peptidase T [Lachnospiraceae bacterium]
MRAYERLLNYVRIWTTSDEDSETVPSSDRQLDLAKILVEEMKAMGVMDARVDEKGYVYGSLKATEGMEDKPAIGFIAHMDTAPDFNGRDVKPQLIENYDGGDVCLGDSGRTLSVSDFPHLKELKGRTLITTDGTSLLGADDKAGIADIMTAIDEIIKENRPHGRLCIGFTPDEEVGKGADFFDVKGFGADFAYTVDGSKEGEIEYENFNASEAVFKVHGVNVHPGEAKNIMVNASLIAMEINKMLPDNETPRHTEGYEGFYHLTDMTGNVEHAELKYIVRDHDGKLFSDREERLRSIERLMHQKHGEGTVELEIRESYRNMKEKIEACMHLIENAKTAIKKEGIEPKVSPIRGGTDGARLSFMGLPCPNLGTGGYAFHGPFEHITVEGMDKAVNIIKNIVDIYARS